MSSERPPKKKRKKRYLLTAVALSTGTMMSGCGSQQGSEDPSQGTGTQGEVREVEPLPLPANPKGAVYDDGVNRPNDPWAQPIEGEPSEEQPTGETEPTNEEPSEEPTPEPQPEPEPTRPAKVLPLPANPKGALYDRGMYVPPSDEER